MKFENLTFSKGRKFLLFYKKNNTAMSNDIVSDKIFRNEYEQQIEHISQQQI